MRIKEEPYRHFLSSFVFLNFKGEKQRLACKFRTRHLKQGRDGKLWLIKKNLETSRSLSLIHFFMNLLHVRTYVCIEYFVHGLLST